MARALETVARALAKAARKDKRWVDFECDAAELLRSLKGQPPHVVDAGDSKFASEALDAMLEAMARS
jgi:hypothetical protein